VSLTRVDAVTFDVGSTLLTDPAGESRPFERRALKKWLQSRGVVKKERLRGVLATAGRAWSEADVGTPRVAAKAADSIVASLGLQVTDGERARLRELMADIYRERPHCAAEGAADALRRLKEHGIELGIVSNRGARPGRFVMRQLEANGLADFFNPAAIIWSDEVGVSKPDPRIYLSCLRALGIPPERAAHVGDKKVKDVDGARRLGMTTIRYAGIRDDHKDGPEADTVIFHYRELAPALGLSGSVPKLDRDLAQLRATEA
jgi:HAD superfamily hydrolase (TIGR01549 family)